MAKPKPSKYSRAHIRSRARRPRRNSSRGWIIATVAIAVVGTLLVVLSYKENQDKLAVAPIVNQDHWHAYLGVNVCGTWEPAVPAFEGRDGSPSKSGPIAGIHSHGDGLVHDHPFASDESGAKATLGRYLGYAQSEVTETSMKLWSNWVAGVDKQNGDTCPKSKKPAVVQWKVGQYGKPWPTKARTGNPSDLKIENGQIIALYFLPKGEALDKPPGADDAMTSIADNGGKPAVATSSTTATSQPATDSSSTTTTGSAGSTSSSTP